MTGGVDSLAPAFADLVWYFGCVEISETAFVSKVRKVWVLMIFVKLCSSFALFR